MQSALKNDKMLSLSLCIAVKRELSSNFIGGGGISTLGNFQYPTKRGVHWKRRQKRLAEVEEVVSCFAHTLERELDH